MFGRKILSAYEEVKNDYLFYKINLNSGFIKVLLCPTYWLLVNHRTYQLIRILNLHKSIKAPLKLINFILKIFFEICSKSSLLDSTQIGSPFFLSNNGGITLGANIIGKGCVIQENVTVGMDLNEKKPTIGDHVIIKKNSIVYGDIHIFDGTIIEENTLLTKSIKKKCIVKGNPAKISVSKENDA